MGYHVLTWHSIRCRRGRMQMHPLSGRRLTVSELCKGTANFGSRISHNQY